jgi:hypothetical protein
MAVVGCKLERLSLSHWKRKAIFEWKPIKIKWASKSTSVFPRLKCPRLGTRHDKIACLDAISETQTRLRSKLHMTQKDLEKYNFLTNVHFDVSTFRKPMIHLRSEYRAILGIIRSTILPVFIMKDFRFLEYPWTTYLCKHPVGFSLTDLRRLDKWFRVPLVLLFPVTSNIWSRTVRCCYSYRLLSAFLTVW